MSRLVNENGGAKKLRPALHAGGVVSVARTLEGRTEVVASESSSRDTLGSQVGREKETIRTLRERKKKGEAAEESEKKKIT